MTTLAIHTFGISDTALGFFGMRFSKSVLVPFFGSTNSCASFFAALGPRMVRFCVAAAGHKRKVLNAIVLAVLVDVMNMLRSVEVSTYMKRHYKSVLWDIPLSVRHGMIRLMYKNIAFSIHYPTPAPHGVIFPGLGGSMGPLTVFGVSTLKRTCAHFFYCFGRVFSSVHSHGNTPRIDDREYLGTSALNFKGGA